MHNYCTFEYDTVSNAYICSNCDVRYYAADCNGESSLWLDSKAMFPNYCPNCGLEIDKRYY